MSELRNPGLLGEVPFDPVIYASPGVNYSAVAALDQYFVYDTPDPRYLTGRIDLSAFAHLGFGAPWPFNNTAVPINGHLRVPTGRGPFPLVLFAHGNHAPLVNSAPGYLYLCDLLASYGVIAGSIDVNFLNGFNFGENAARAILHLEHLKQFRTWNSTAGHPLRGKIDLNRTMIVGHSRGAEGVGHASWINRLPAIKPFAFSPTIPLDGSAGLGPYRFAISAVVAIAPTDRQYVPLSGPTVVQDPYFLMHGSRDGDVSTFEGYNTYDRAHAIDLANPTVSHGKFKGLLWIYRADHNQFNSLWPPEFSPAPPISRPEQEQIAKVHLGVLAQAALLGHREYFAALHDHAAAAYWVPPQTTCVSQFQDGRRIYLQHEQEGPGIPQVSLPVQGTVVADSVVATRQTFDLVNSGAPQNNLTLRLNWSTSSSRLILLIDPATLAARRYRVLSLRAGQSTEAANPPQRDQDFRLEVSSGSRTVALRASSWHRLIYPDIVFGAGKVVMQTFRLPLERLAKAGLDLDDIRSIALVFDQRPAGTIYVGDLQISE